MAERDHSGTAEETDPLVPEAPSASTDVKPNAPAKEDGPTLYTFIQDNQKFLSVLGVFTTLTIFTTTLSFGILGDLLSCLFFSITLILWLEFHEHFPPKSPNAKLYWFENLLFISVLVLALYWLVQYRTVWRLMLWLAIFLSLLYVEAYWIREYDVFNRLFRTPASGRKWLRHLGFVVVVAGTLAITFMLSNLLGIKLNRALDRLYSEIHPAAAAVSVPADEAQTSPPGLRLCFSRNGKIVSGLECDSSRRAIRRPKF
jgi:hypothetical protein